MRGSDGNPGETGSRLRVLPHLGLRRRNSGEPVAAIKSMHAAQVAGADEQWKVCGSLICPQMGKALQRGGRLRLVTVVISHRSNNEVIELQPCYLAGSFTESLHDLMIEPQMFNQTRFQ